MRTNVLWTSALSAQRVSSVMRRSGFPYWATTQTIQEQVIIWAEEHNLKYSPQRCNVRYWHLTDKQTRPVNWSLLGQQRTSAIVGADILGRE
jgi:hypothetical protein